MRKCIFLGFHLFGLVLFLMGFFPIKKILKERATFRDLPEEPFNSQNCSNLQSRLSYKSSLDSLVVMIIDGLREDFLLSENGHKNFPYLHSLITSNQALAFRSRAHSPTVTMPRIKAITSGGISNFIDVIFNFFSTEIEEDNIINLAYMNQRKLVFYGDDTWLKLFPGKFLRSEGTTSFFVSDYTEVDHNVTRHLEKELKQSDWQILILHYLGLDHIGHLEGPFSNLVEAKLNEMDNVIKYIHSILISEQKANGPPSLLMITGDHGISDFGGHGGASDSEILTPLAFLASVPSLWNKDVKQHADVAQIDIASTLSILLGLPIPKNNVGVAILPVLSFIEERQLLYSLYMNCYQVVSTLQENFPVFKQSIGFSFWKLAKKMHSEWLQKEICTYKTNSTSTVVSFSDVIKLYTSTIKEISKDPSFNLNDHDIYLMTLSLVFLWQVLIVYLGTSLVKNYRVVKSNLYFVSRNYVITFLVLSAVHMLQCSTGYRNSKLCQLTSFGIGLSTLLIGMFCYIFGELLFLKNNFSFSAVKQGFPSSYSGRFFIFTWIFHSLSLTSSSFIEEEHRTFYFFSISMQIILALDIFHKHFYSNLTKKKKLHFAAKLSNKRQSVLDSNEQIVKKGLEFMEVREKSTSEIILYISSTAVLSRILFDWNHTGDKWAYIPDIGDWLNKPENIFILSAGSLLGLSLIAYMRMKFHGMLSKMIILSCCVIIYGYRTTMGLLFLPKIVLDFPLGWLFDATNVYYLISILTVWEIFNSFFAFTKSKIRMISSLFNILVTVWLLFLSLLFRPHNVILLAIITLQEHFFSQILNFLSVDSYLISATYLIMATTSFFYQGNSNSLSRIDVSAGYIGLSYYQPFWVCFFIFCHTYGGYFFWLIMLIQKIFEKITVTPMRCSSIISDVAEVLSFSRTVPITVYAFVIFIQRHHLFIWSVFSPKLLYETVLTFILVLLSCQLIVISSLINLSSKE